MRGERLSMRKIREVLRLWFGTIGASALLRGACNSAPVR